MRKLGASAGREVAPSLRMGLSAIMPRSLENAFQAIDKALLLFLRVIGGCDRRRVLRRSARRPRGHHSNRIRSAARSSDYCVSRCRRCRLFPSGELCPASMQVAELSRLCTNQVIFVSGARAGAGGELAAQWVDLDTDNSVGRGEIRHVAIGTMSMRALHELGPHR